MQSCIITNESALQNRSVWIKSLSRISYKCKPSRKTRSRGLPSSLIGSYVEKKSSLVDWYIRHMGFLPNTSDFTANFGSTAIEAQLASVNESPACVPISRYARGPNEQ